MLENKVTTTTELIHSSLSDPLDIFVSPFMINIK